MRFNIVRSNEMVCDPVKKSSHKKSPKRIGGIKKNTISDTNSRTPGVSKVPVVGNLFKSKNKKDELKELLIFIAPRVID